MSRFPASLRSLPVAYKLRLSRLVIVACMVLQLQLKKRGGTIIAAVREFTSNDLITLLRRVRIHVPGSARAALLHVDETLHDLAAVDASALVIPSRRTIYLTRWPDGCDPGNVGKRIDRLEGQGYRTVVLERQDEADGKITSGRPVSMLRVPLLDGRSGIGAVILLKRGAGAFDGWDRERLPFLSEVLSTVLHPFLTPSGYPAEHGEENPLKIELLEAIGDEALMRIVLRNIAERSQAEFCAFFAAEKGGQFHIMLEGRELSPLIPAVREKLGAVYGMFVNRREDTGMLSEKVYYRRGDGNVAYLLGKARIESYFLVPVTFDSKVRGLLYIGSVRKDAFGRDDIGAFRSLAEESGKTNPLVFKVGGGMEILGEALDAIPFGGAVVSPDGEILHANRAFSEVLRIYGEVPESINEISGVSPFNLQGVWDEFTVLRRNLVERELHGVGVPERVVAVSWIVLDGIAENAGSFVFIKDITGVKERENAREEMLATAAHELRTPMTALKNSLSILLSDDPHERNASSGRMLGERNGRFLRTALRTISRLGMIVDGIIDVSSRGADEAPLELETVGVRSFLEEASVLFVESFARKGIDFDVRVANSMDDLVFDRNRMEQVIQNLLSNSLKHVASGQRIEISVQPCATWPAKAFPSVPWNLMSPPSIADICIRDTGSGIPDEVMEMVNPSDSEVEKLPSQGLGLYISRSLIRRQGGSLIVEREAGGGSNVHLYMPVDVETARVVLTVRIIEEKITGLIGRGATPVLYGIVKNTPRCWLEIAGTWRVKPTVNPGRAETGDEGFFLWPIGERFAIGLDAAGKCAADPMSFIRNGRGGLRLLEGTEADGISIGWAVGPRDGAGYAELMGTSLERLGIECAAPRSKGENSEWQ